MTLRRIALVALQLAIAVFFVCAAATSAAAQAQLKWEKLAPFPEPAEEILGATANGKMYVFAGFIPYWHPKGLVYEYDPASDHWTKKKQMALPSHHVAFTGYKGKIYAFGGFVYPTSGPPGWVPIDNAWEYDPVADSWKALAPMPSKRGSPVAVAVGDKIYVIGGVETMPGATDPAINQSTPQLVVGTVEEYDPEKNTWRERTPMPTPRNHAAIGAVNGKIYVIGGRVGAAYIGLATDVSVVEEYDPATDKWGAPRARMPTARSALGYGTVNGRIYIAGGEFQDPHMMATFRQVEAYEPASNTWSILPPMPVSRHGLAGGAIGNRLIFVGGDVQSSGTGVDVSTSEVDALVISDSGH